MAVTFDGVGAEALGRGGEVELAELGELTPVARAGGQGRVYEPQWTPEAFGPDPFVVKLYRSAPEAAWVLAEMVEFGRRLAARGDGVLARLTAWPLALVVDGRGVRGTVMYDLRPRFEAPFVMPSGRRDVVLLQLEHLLQGDDYLEQRGLPVRLDTAVRARVAERVAAALAFLHGHAIVASDISPNNVLVSFRGGAPAVAFIDCDSMVFRGRQALATVETGDWNIPDEFGESPRTRAADAYKIGLMVLRLFAREHDARSLKSHAQYVPPGLHELVRRSLASNAAGRPAPAEWQRGLRRAMATELNRVAPGPRPAPRERAAMRPIAAEARPRRIANPVPLTRRRRPAWLRDLGWLAAIIVGPALLFAAAAALVTIATGSRQPQLVPAFGPHPFRGRIVRAFPGTPLGAPTSGGVGGAGASAQQPSTLDSAGAQPGTRPYYSPPAGTYPYEPPGASNTTQPSP